MTNRNRIFKVEGQHSNSDSHSCTHTLRTQRKNALGLRLRSYDYGAPGQMWISAGLILAVGFIAVFLMLNAVAPCPADIATFC